jgi:hypothetical protein
MLRPELLSRLAAPLPRCVMLIFDSDRKIGCGFRCSFGCKLRLSLENLIEH